MKNLFTLLFLLQLIQFSFAQGVAINTDDSDPDASAILDVKSTSQGMLLPRLTSSQRNTISGPATGLMIFNTDRKCIEYYSGSEWTSSTPAGTIRAFGGSTVPDGWLVCDGTEVGRTVYSDLFSLISIKWGGGNGVSTFNLPDLRGRFLRGRDNGSGIDPDAASRTALFTSGNSGDAVGSYQDDAFQGHWHSVGNTDGQSGFTVGYIGPNGGTGTSNPPCGCSGVYRVLDRALSPVTDNINGTPRSSSESRPENANVVFIIKY